MQTVCTTWHRHQLMCVLWFCFVWMEPVSPRPQQRVKSCPDVSLGFSARPSRRSWRWYLFTCYQPCAYLLLLMLCENLLSIYKISLFVFLNFKKHIGVGGQSSGDQLPLTGHPGKRRHIPQEPPKKVPQKEKGQQPRENQVKEGPLPVSWRFPGHCRTRVSCLVHIDHRGQLERVPFVQGPSSTWPQWEPNSQCWAGPRLCGALNARLGAGEKPLRFFFFSC